MNDVSTEQVLMPASTEEVAELLRAGTAGNSRFCTSRVARSGMDSATAVQRVDLQKMSLIVDYPARDMTVTVQAGMAVSELTGILAEEKQQLPIDVVDSSMSVGALVAGDIAGPRQYGYGTLRDYVIGIEAVDGQGRVFHAGGRVVKNVAGYDLCRLIVGARGSLGILTQVTFKLKPLPEYSMLRSYRCDDAAGLEDSLDGLNVSAASPVLLDFDFSPDVLARQIDKPSAAGRRVPYAVHIGVEGTEAACLWQIDELRNECAAGEEIDAGDSSSVDEHCRRAEYNWQDDVVRVRTLPSKLMTVASELAAAGYASRGHAGNGILFVKKEDGDGRVRAICEEIVSRHGGAVSEWSVDHPANSTDQHSVRLRSAFDPHSVFAT
jgi:glycolate oxidase FAD binding subunit